MVLMLSINIHGLAFSIHVHGANSLNLHGADAQTRCMLMVLGLAVNVPVKTVSLVMFMGV